VLYDRKGIVKMMEQLLPFLIGLRLSKVLGLVFQPLPVNEENVPIGLFHASLKLV
jgi:hypothetical protein